MNPILGRSGAAALVAVVASAGALAQQSPRPEQLIKWRQSAFQVVAWNNGRIKASLEGTYNKEEVVKAANTIAAIANGGLGSLFAPGTDRGKGWHDTNAKPELFQDGNSRHVGELALNFAKEASELARVAAAGDAASVKEQFGKVNRTCKACHDDFRAKD
ncbi:MAG TPA: cytochrome c [Albitalea sp.]|uniref:c-type cytochrome n=1 Tax=Piscinibacter sp. TaxID=1903157 RepID=UPI002ED626F7